MSSRGEASHSFVRLNGSDLHIGKSVINGRALVLSVFVIFVLMTIVRHQQLWRASRQIGNYKSGTGVVVSLVCAQLSHTDRCTVLRGSDYG